MLPEQGQCHIGAAQLAVHPSPVGRRPLIGGRPGSGGNSSAATSSQWDRIRGAQKDNQIMKLDRQATSRQASAAISGAIRLMVVAGTPQRAATASGANSGDKQRSAARANAGCADRPS